MPQSRENERRIFNAARDNAMTRSLVVNVLMAQTSGEELKRMRNFGYGEIELKGKTDVATEARGFAEMLRGHRLFRPGVSMEAITDFVGTFMVIGYQVGLADAQLLKHELITQYDKLVPGVVNPAYRSNYTRENHPVDLVLESGVAWLIQTERRSSAELEQPPIALRRGQAGAAGTPLADYLTDGDNDAWLDKVLERLNF